MVQTKVRTYKNVHNFYKAGSAFSQTMTKYDENQSPAWGAGMTLSMEVQ
jgi:hypothetical protein